ncbi:MAG: hypothetical protein A2136_08980 [Chloroflexi bacterium RBG_16_54_11]|nr:MAG: hypothetical protein A2136_08980 [Chloroflexi bacterium RBG_16_54_11]
MNTSPGSSQLPKSQTSWLSLLQLVLSALGALLLLSVAFVIVTTDFAQQIFQVIAGADRTQSYMVAASLAFAGILFLPSAWYAWKHITHPEAVPAIRAEPRRFGLLLTIVVVVLVSGALLLGDRVSRDTRIAWLVLPPLNILATGLPALWLVYFGTRDLIPGSPSRKWGVFTSGLVLSPVIILVLEFIVLIFMGILAILWILLDPSLSGQFNSLIYRLQNAGTNPETYLRIMMPLILNPGIIILMFAFVSVIVPMIEEALKPVGMWFLVGQKITPAQGFGYGVLSGVGFGLFENLGNTSSGGEAWALLASTRISTLLLHCLNAGLVGWALASAWSQRRYLRLVVTYFFAILLHGLWNGMAVMSFFSSLESFTNLPVPNLLVRAGSLSTIGIILLGAFNLVFFIAFNTALRRSLGELYITPKDTPSLVSASGENPPPGSSPAPTPHTGSPPEPQPGTPDPLEGEKPPAHTEAG